MWQGIHMKGPLEKDEFILTGESLLKMWQEIHMKGPLEKDEFILTGESLLKMGQGIHTTQWLGSTHLPVHSGNTLQASGLIYGN